MPVIEGTSGNDTLDGTSGDDRIFGYAGNDLINGLGGRDYIEAGSGNDTVNGGDGDDQIYTIDGNDVIDGGAGIDIWGGDFTANTSGLTATFATSIQVSNNVIVNNVEHARVLTGTGGDHFFINRTGQISIFAGQGWDTVVYTNTEPVNHSYSVTDFGGFITGSAGEATFQDVESVSLTGGSGDEFFAISGAFSDVSISIDGGTGFDSLQASLGRATTLIVNPDGSITSNIGSFAGLESFTILGSVEGDTLIGGAASDTIDGYDGTDLVRGGAGNDLLYGGGNDDQVHGDGGDDEVNGGGGNDVVSGGTGLDSLTGDIGFDTFIGTASELSGDIITDFSNIDRIVISDASLNDFTFSLSGSTLTFTGGSLTLANYSGALQFGAAPEGGVELFVNDAANDFNGDGRSDILWRNIDGTLSNWLGQANGGFVANDANAAVSVPSEWNVVGTGDFNGDGRDDILWRHTDGTLSDWLGEPTGGFLANDSIAAVFVPNDWSVVGTGDFNGDGRDDILWRNADGTVSNWLGQEYGEFVANDANAARFAPTDWHVVGTGDFNGDGRDDILWRNDNGQLSNWLGQANGGFLLNDAAALTTVPTGWFVAGTGDFNGDGRDDILWRHTDGQLSNWLGEASGGFTPNDANAAVLVPTEWTVVATGDYNGDGRDDILWRHTDGTLSNWLGTATGGFTPNDSNAATPVPVSWEVQPDYYLN